MVEMQIAETEKQTKDARPPFLMDADELRSLASEPIIKRGIAYFNEHRVIDLGWDDRTVTALVQGSDADVPYSVELGRDRDGELWVSCSCPFDWEPICKHAVATLLAYAAQHAATDTEVDSAAEREVADRARRGRSEVVVEHVEGEPWFGTWAARSVSASAYAPHSYRVQLRSFDERSNHCTCPDFAVNRLGTCKHIEAVRHKVGKRFRRKIADMVKNGPPLPFVYLAWDVKDAPQLRLQRSKGESAELASLLETHFDDEGAMRGRLPDAFHFFVRRTTGREDVLVGDEVQGHVRRLSEEAMHRIEGQRIRREIERSGGQLPGLRARLYPYQVEGVAFLASTGRALLADDMGLGKTLQSIAAAHWLVQSAGVRRVLVVCPSSLKHQWAREIRKFTDHTVEVVQGAAAARQVQYRRHADFTIVNYELVLRDARIINEEMNPDLVVLDEAQRIKNWRTKSAAAIKSLESRYAFVLTGTPLENRLEDLYSLMQVVDPRVLGPLWRYMLDFHIVDPRGKVLGYRNLSELRHRIAPVMLRRDRRLVRDQLPDRIELRLDVPMSQRQKELHDDALAAAYKYANILKKRPLTPAEEKRLLAALQTARMACNAAGLVDGKTEGSPKLDDLGKLLEDLCVGEGRKAVVFSQWERMTAMAERTARSLGLGTVRLHGGVPTAKRGELIDRFMGDDAVQVFLSTDAGGVGLNLQAASVLINLDMPFNPAVLDQRIARIHRLGQTEPVQVILMVADDSYEQRVTQLMTGKRALFNSVVDPESMEDVVGVDRRDLEAMLEALDGDGREAGGVREDEPPLEDTVAAPPETQRDDDRELRKPGTEHGTDHDLVELVRVIERRLPGRIEQILGADGGLIVVVDAVDDVARAVMDEPAPVPVAVVDAATAAALSRFAHGSPFGGAKELWRPEAPAEPAPTEPPLLALARRKLQAAEILVSRECGTDAVELLAASMLAAASHKAGLSDVVPQASATVWLYGDALPKGLLPMDTVTAILRATSLCHAPSVPEKLVEQVLADARALSA